MSFQAPGAGSASARPGPAKPVWKTSADGRTTFRLNPPLVIWWVWVVFAAANLLDLLIQSRDWFALEITAVVAVVTAVMYACTFRPRVITDAAGLTVRNPFRDYRVGWGGVSGVFLGDSVEIQCQQPAPRESRTVYSWALYSPRRARARAEMRMASGPRRQRYSQRRFEVPDSAGYGKAPPQARAMSRQHASHAMAGELARRCSEAKAAGAAEGVLAGSWAWLPIAAVLASVAFLVAVIAAH